MDWSNLDAIPAKSDNLTIRPIACCRTDRAYCGLHGSRGVILAACSHLSGRAEPVI